MKYNQISSNNKKRRKLFNTYHKNVHYKNSRFNFSNYQKKNKNKKKNIVEILQSYGGLAALIIAIGYSWPLGIWDRFYVDPQKAIDQKIAEIRESLYQAAGHMIELAKTQSSIPDPQLREYAGRASQNQILLLVKKLENDAAINRNKLLSEELIFIALIYQNLGMTKDSIKFFEYASNKDGNSEFVKVEIDRQLAKSYFLPSPVQDRAKARKIYKRVIPKAMQSNEIIVKSQGIDIQSEWGIFEMMGGDWKCGVHNLDLAIAELKKIQPMIQDRGTRMTMLQQRRISMVRQLGQSDKGC